MTSFKILSVVALSLVFGCQKRTFGQGAGSAVKSDDNASVQRDYEEVKCGFLCPGSTQPAGKSFTTQRALCERGEIKPFGHGSQLVTKIGATTVSMDLFDVEIPRCANAKLVVLDTDTDGLSLPQYPTLAQKLKMNEIFEGLHNQLIPLKAAVTDDGEWGVLRVNDERYLIKKVAGIRSPDGVGVYNAAAGYPDAPQTDDKIHIELFRRDGKFIINVKKLMGL